MADKELYDTDELLKEVARQDAIDSTDYRRPGKIQPPSHINTRALWAGMLPFISTVILLAYVGALLINNHTAAQSLETFMGMVVAFWFGQQRSKVSKSLKGK